VAQKCFQYPLKLMLNQCQGRNEVRWRPGQEASLAPPWSNLRSFGGKFTALKEALVIFWGLLDAPAGIRRPHSDSAPGELCPPCPSLRSWSVPIDVQMEQWFLIVRAPPRGESIHFQGWRALTRFRTRKFWSINLPKNTFAFAAYLSQGGLKQRAII